MNSQPAARLGRALTFQSGLRPGPRGAAVVQLPQMSRAGDSESRTGLSA